MEEPRHDPNRARVALVFAVLAIVCVLAGFVVGIVRSHGDPSHQPVTVETTVAIGGSRWADGHGDLLEIVSRSMPRADPPANLPDPLARQAATLLSKAMLSSRDRDSLWDQFHELVNEETTRLEEAPVRELLAEAERRGIRLDVVARVAVRSLDPEPADSLVAELRRARAGEDEPAASRDDA